MSEAFEAGCKCFTTPTSLRSCAKFSPDELLQRQDLVNVTWFVCEQPRLPGLEDHHPRS